MNERIKELVAEIDKCLRNDGGSTESAKQMEMLSSQLEFESYQLFWNRMRKKNNWAEPKD